MDKKLDDFQRYPKLSRRQQISALPNKDSDSEVIISALKTLQLKLHELENERNQASKLIMKLNRNGEDLLRRREYDDRGDVDTTQSTQIGISATELNNVKLHCEKIEGQLMNILAASRGTQSVSTADRPIISKCKTPKKNPKERKHFKADYRVFPFVPSGSQSVTFSLPATIQTLLSNLKSQHGELCLLSDTGASLKNVLIASENYLNRLMETVLSAKQYLNTERSRISAPENKGVLLSVLSQSEFLSKMTEQIVQLQNQVTALKKQASSLTTLEAETGHKLSSKQPAKTSSVPSLKSKRLKAPEPRNQMKKAPRVENLHPFHQRSSTSVKKSTKIDEKPLACHQNAETLRYVKMLQVSLRKTGYRLKMTED